MRYIFGKLVGTHNRRLNEETLCLIHLLLKNGISIGYEGLSMRDKPFKRSYFTCKSIVVLFSSIVVVLRNTDHTLELNTDQDSWRV